MNNNKNELLRSAYQIASRKGADTNWEAFKRSIEKELLADLGLDELEKDEQKILRATCTARVYRNPSED